MMNNANEISKQTKLFGYIGEHAGTSRFSTLLNKRFKENGVDAMMIPMNIREDDFFFTLTNMKNSHVSGAVISNEYVRESVAIVDEANALVKRSGMCDLVLKKEGKLHGDLFGIRVLAEHLKDLRVQKIALLGIGAHAKAFAFLACGFEVSYFNENLEALMRFIQEVELRDADINRIALGMELDLSRFDALLDFSDEQSLSMITKLPLHNFDMKHTKQFSPLRQRAAELGGNYTSYDDLLEPMTQAVYRIIK